MLTEKYFRIYCSICSFPEVLVLLKVILFVRSATSFCELILFPKIKAKL